jgi:CMP-N-acetylneuraminic acid synthetase
LKIVAFCPIKLNNRRLPGKNVRELGGKPLMNHSIETVLDADMFDEVYVFCSDDSICSLLPQNVKFLKRSALLDSDDTKGKDIYQAFAMEVKADYYFLFHVTSPYLTKRSIIKAIDSLSLGYDSSFSAVKAQTFGWHKGLPVNFEPENPKQTQLLDSIYLETSSFFLAPARSLLRGVRYGEKPFVVEVEERESVDIDNIEDWEKAEKYL